MKNRKEKQTNKKTKQKNNKTLNSGRKARLLERENF